MNRRLALPLLAIAAGGVFSVPAGASLRQVGVGNFFFEDETVGDGKVEAQVGDQLRFNVLDGGPGTPHTVDVDELGIHSGSLSSGETFTTPPLAKAGTYVLYCKPHDQRGHKTNLVVTAATFSPPTTAPTTTTTAPPTATTPTTTAAPTTVTTAKSTTTTKPPATVTTATTAARPSVSTSSSTTAPPATTSPTTLTLGGSAQGVAASGDANPGSPTSGAGAAAGSVNGDGASTNGGDASETALAPVGRGTIDEQAGLGSGSLDGLLNRRLGRGGPWTRSIRLALAALVPMALAAGVVLRRWPGPPSDVDGG